MRLVRLVLIFLYTLMIFVDMYFVYRIRCNNNHGSIFIDTCILVVSLVSLVITFVSQNNSAEIFFIGWSIILALTGLMSYLMILDNKGLKINILLVFFVILFGYLLSSFILKPLAEEIIGDYGSDITTLGLFASLVLFTKEKLIPYSEEYYERGNLSEYICPRHVPKNRINNIKASISFICDFIELLAIIYSLVVLNNYLIIDKYLGDSSYFLNLLSQSALYSFAYIFIIYFIIYSIFYCNGCTKIFHNKYNVKCKFVSKHKSSILDCIKSMVKDINI